MGMLSEFKSFAVKGNVVDMAVGIIIGAAFGKIVAALVGGVILPPIGLAMGGVNFTDLSYTLQSAAEGKEAITIKWGAFVQTIIDFIILAFCIFMAVRVINNMKKKEEAAPAAPPKEQVLLEEIRDLLKK